MDYAAERGGRGKPRLTAMWPTQGSCRSLGCDYISGTGDQRRQYGGTANLGFTANEQGVGDFVAGFGVRRIDPDCRVDTQLLAQNQVSERTTQEAIAAMTLRYSPRSRTHLYA